MDSSSILGSSKRARAPGNVAHCLVDGCDADLSLCRDYHRRHKVCEAHSKTARVTIGGREQRFCQQCSRFHSLVEFDEGKRSCRKRLDGHNRRRRRKPQPESLSRVFSNQHQGSLLSFSSPQMLPTAFLSSSENDIVTHQQQQLQNSFPQQSFKTINQLDFVCQPHPHAAIDKVFPNSDRALSLLSPTPREFGLNHVAVAHGLHYYCCEYPYGEGSKAAGGGGRGISEGSSTAGSHQTLTFTWE